MEFKKIQSADNGQITNWFVNNKAVTPAEFENQSYKCIEQGMKYNSSSTTRDKNNNFVHLNYYN